MSKLDDIKVGDEVAVFSSSLWSRAVPRKATVERTTATQIAIDGNIRFSRRYGREIGGSGSLRIEPWCDRYDRLLAEAAIEAARSTVLYAMENREQTRKLTLDQLLRIAVILRETSDE